VTFLVPRSNGCKIVDRAYQVQAKLCAGIHNFVSESSGAGFARVRFI
jgi:hypothetical protein